MSRVGNKPVSLPKGVTVEVGASEFTVKGPKGELKQAYDSVIEFDIKDAEIVLTRKNEAKQSKAFHGLYRSLLNNMVIGVSEGYKKTLLINGVGYRADVKGDTLLLNLGFSTQFEYIIPEGVKISCDGQTKVIVEGIEKQQVGQVASEIRSIRPPEPYKGKGIKYENEYIRRKVGKSGVK